MNRRGKYKNNYYCSRDGWVRKEKCLIVTLPSGMRQIRCPYCNRPIRLSPRASYFKEKYPITPRTIEGREEVKENGE